MFHSWCAKPIKNTIDTVVNRRRHYTTYYTYIFFGKQELPQQISLSFNQHFDITVARALKFLGFIKRNLKHFTSVHCLRLLYFTLVRSILEYRVVHHGVASIPYKTSA